MKPTGLGAEAPELNGQEARRVRTARPPGYDFRNGASLALRRAWYAEGEGDPDKGDPNKGKGDDKGGGDDKTDPLDAWVQTLPKEAQAGAQALVLELRQTRGEAKDRRLKLEKLEKDQQDAETQRQKVEQDKLAQQGEWEKLANERATEIGTLTGFKAEAEELRQTLQGILDKRLESVPEHLRPLVKQMKATDALTWLETNADKLAPRHAPDGDGDKKGDKQKPAPDKNVVLEGRKVRY